MKRIYIATANPDKFREIAAILRPFMPKSYGLFSIRGLKDKPKIIENGRTYKENALKKAKAIASRTKCIAIADDSGLEVRSLHNMPGIRSARFSGAHGDYKKNNLKLLKLLTGLPKKRRRARFVCTALAYFPKKNKHAFCTKKVHGFIKDREIGKQGFGYDPVFYYPPFKKTFAQVPVCRKNRVSHRAKAFRALGIKLRKILNSLS